MNAAPTTSPVSSVGVFGQPNLPSHATTGNTKTHPGLRLHAFAWRWISVLFLAQLAFRASPAERHEKGSPATNPARSATGAASTNRVISDLNLELIWIKPGTFIMGSPADEPDRNKAEGPQMTVTLTKGFWLGKTEVTQGQYEVFTGSNPSRFKEAGTNAPAEEVSWIDAMEFCRKLTERERAAGRLPDGYTYTLPTEAQWEYACRAGTTRDYAGNPDAMAWNDRNSGETTHPVGTKKPNDWGLYDMSGNVLEWCLDWYGDYPGGFPTDPTGPRSGYFRMARGGSWRMAIRVGRSAARAGGSPGRHDYTLGFRLGLCPVRP